ncbi:hypothetical protein CapIbe_003424 [Capra ibex]
MERTTSSDAPPRITKTSKLRRWLQVFLLGDVSFTGVTLQTSLLLLLSDKINEAIFSDDNQSMSQRRNTHRKGPPHLSS